GGEPALCATLQSILRARGYAASAAMNGTEAMALMLREEFELLIMSAQLPGSLSGLDLIPYAQIDQPQAAIIILAEDGAVPPHASEAMHPFAVVEPWASPAAIADVAAAALTQHAQ